jgi:hypothetical protein
VAGVDQMLADRYADIANADKADRLHDILPGSRWPFGLVIDGN